MLDAHKEIQALVDNFVADLSALARRIAIDRITAAFGVGSQPAAPRPAPGATPAQPLPQARTMRARRGQREIEVLRGKVLAVIAENPGRRAEEINAMLGTRTPQIAQLLRRLVADQLVRTEGARRGTRYFAMAPVPHGRRGGEAAAEDPAS